MTELNLEPNCLEMEKLSSIWKCRKLTLIRKITIMKTLMISIIIHILLSLPRPSDESFKDIENVFFKFLWQDKPPEFEISTPLGGLHYFPDVRRNDMIMNASWMKRIYKSDEGWAAIPTFYGLNMIYNNGVVFLQKRQKLICNIF